VYVFIHVNHLLHVCICYCVSVCVCSLLLFLLCCLKALYVLSYCAASGVIKNDDDDDVGGLSRTVPIVLVESRVRVVAAPKRDQILHRIDWRELRSDICRYQRY